MDFFPKNFIAATEVFGSHTEHVNAPYFRKRFTFTKGKNAKIRICGLGFYELYINGKNVTKGRLAPYITNPDESLYYDDYDVTEWLIDGENVIGVWLGNGLQNNPYGDVWNFDKAGFRSAPKFALAFIENGEVAFESDTSFVCAPSPITFDDLRAGEHYDARLEIAGWNLTSLDDSDWAQAIPAKTPTGKAKIVEAEPILVHEILKPVSVVKTPKGFYLYDFGVNFTGVCRLKIRGQRGQQVRLTHGEIILDGDLNMDNLGFDKFPNREPYNQCDWYTLKGGDEEIYAPRFTYHGFQYVQVEGLTDEQATLDLLTFEVMYSAVKKRGDFVCSDAMLNILQGATQRSDLSNLFYIPTDCPHREKNGWTGDIALSADQMMMNFAVETTLADWLFSVRNAQDGRGAIPAIVPTGGWGFAWGAGPNWDDALFECAYQIYRYTGDKKVILDNADAMEKYLLYMQTKKQSDGLFCYGLGDWCQPKVNFQFTTPNDFTDTIKCIDICRKTAQMARAVERVDLAELAENMAVEIHRDFKAKYIQNGCSAVTEQTAVAFLLYYHIADECREALQRQLLECIERDGGVFHVGVLGARVLFRVLSDMGEADLAHKLIVQPNFPSYAYNVVRGATTSLPENFYEMNGNIWRCLNGRKHDSLNHHFWGDISAWMIAYVAGIRVNPTCDNVDSVEIAPQFLTDLTFAEGRFTHRKGEIVSRWQRDGAGLTLRLVLPAGVSASLRLPMGYFTEDTLHAGEQMITVYKK